MIVARLVGDDAVLAWLRATPDLAASVLARAMTTLGIELQRKIQENELTGQTLMPAWGRSDPAQACNSIRATTGLQQRFPATANMPTLTDMARLASERSCAVLQRRSDARGLGSRSMCGQIAAG
jgi:hypothetical protein